MLTHLQIFNLATVGYLEITFKGGLNVLTGETGAGKSVIIDAIDLLVGEKANVDIIRTGESAAIIEGVFALQATCEDKVNDILVDVGIQTPSGAELLIRREVHTNGRSRIFP